MSSRRFLLPTLLLLGLLTAFGLELADTQARIEDATQLARLRALGCEHGQGYLLSRPLDVAATRELLAGWGPRREALLA